MVNPTVNAGRTAVYWLYDDRDALLYVGVATDPRLRWKQHMSEKSWWGRVQTRVVEWFDSRVEALRVEKDCIERDSPLYNLHGSPIEIGSVSTLKRVGIMGARERLGPLVDQAAAGEPVVILRNRTPLAILIGYTQAQSLLRDSD